MELMVRRLRYVHTITYKIVQSHNLDLNGQNASMYTSTVSPTVNSNFLIDGPIKLIHPSTINPQVFLVA